jgi:hypothetical protein
MFSRYHELHPGGCNEFFGSKQLVAHMPSIALPVLALP